MRHETDQMSFHRNFCSKAACGVFITQPLVCTSAMLPETGEMRLIQFYAEHRMNEAADLTMMQPAAITKGGNICV